MESDDRTGKTQTSKYVEVSMREEIDTSEAYINSKHISGSTDHLGREKPFFNIVVGHRNIWYRATEIDFKRFFIRALKKAHEVLSFLATIHLQTWIKKSGFYAFLNDWGLSLATHGSTVLKFVEKDGELKSKVIDWNTLLCDPVDFDGNIKAEKLWFTPAQLLQQNYDEELTQKLLESTTTRKNMDGQQKDNKSDYILVYEVHGEMPETYLKEGGDEKKYVQQMHVISIVEKKDDKGNKYTEAHSLYSGKESKNPYMITHLIKKDGITYTGGAVKNLFDAQWMTNDTHKKIKDQLDLASKILFQTSDGNFAGQNAMSNLENGDILIYTPNNPLTMLNNKPDIVAMQSNKADWQNIAMQINGINEAMVNAPKSGTAWRQTQAVLQESHDLFNLMMKNKKIYLKMMFQEYILPFLKKKMDTSEEISDTLESWQIKEIDSRYVPNEAIRMVNRKKKDAILSGELYDTSLEGADTAGAETMIKGGLRGTQRFIQPSDIPNETWKDALKDIEWEFDIDDGTVSKDYQAMLETYDMALKFIVSLGGRPMTTTEKLLFEKILSVTGTISPIELNLSEPSPALLQPAVAGVGGVVPQQ